jgi:hypothetical protein
VTPFGAELEIAEAWLWPKTHQALKPVYRRLIEARAELKVSADAGEVAG